MAGTSKNQQISMSKKAGFESGIRPTEDLIPLAEFILWRPSVKFRARSGDRHEQDSRARSGGYLSVSRWAQAAGSRSRRAARAKKREDGKNREKTLFSLLSVSRQDPTSPTARKQPPGETQGKHTGQTCPYPEESGRPMVKTRARSGDWHDQELKGRHEQRRIIWEICGQIPCSVWRLPIRFTVGTGGTSKKIRSTKD